MHDADSAMSADEQELSAEEVLDLALDGLASDYYRGLGCAIIGATVRDIRFPDEDAMQYALDAGFESLDAELECFWDSDWGMMLREMAGLELIELGDLR